MENNKEISIEHKYIGLENLLNFCESQKFDEDKILCYLDCYKLDLVEKTKSPLKGLVFIVENYLYPIMKNLKENGPIFDSYPGEPPKETDEPPKEFESKEKLIADIEKLEKELNIN